MKKEDIMIEVIDKHVLNNIRNILEANNQKIVRKQFILCNPKKNKAEYYVFFDIYTEKWSILQGLNKIDVSVLELEGILKNEN